MLTTLEEIAYEAQCALDAWYALFGAQPLTYVNEEAIALHDHLAELVSVVNQRNREIERFKNEWLNCSDPDQPATSPKDWN